MEQDNERSQLSGRETDYGKEEDAGGQSKGSLIRQTPAEENTEGLFTIKPDMRSRVPTKCCADCMADIRQW